VLFLRIFGTVVPYAFPWLFDPGTQFPRNEKMRFLSTTPWSGGKLPLQPSFCMSILAAVLCWWAKNNNNNNNNNSRSNLPACCRRPGGSPSRSAAPRSSSGTSVRISCPPSASGGTSGWPACTAGPCAARS